MSTHLYLAPAGHGKTAYALARIRQVRAAAPLAPVAVILPNQAQVSAFRRRLSADGGALGVSLGTFYTLYAEILGWAGRPEPRLPESLQYRLLRHIIVRLADEGRLVYYAPLRDKPGFVAAARALVEELKRARIRRDDFRQAIQRLPRPDSRLVELADIYDAYQDWLLNQGWADAEGQGWLAELALERQPHLARHLRLLIVDGFDEFNPTQLAVLKLLTGRAAETIITLTGEWQITNNNEGQIANSEWQISPVVNPQPSDEQSKIVNRKSKTALRRFDGALRALSQTLQLDPAPLPGPPPPPADPALAYLEANLFEVTAPSSTVYRLPSTFTFLEAQNRAEEVRAALRWLKARLVRDKLSPLDAALIARDLAPYRPFVEEIAAEFGLTLYLRDGLHLATNPAIAALMSLLALPLKRGPADNWARRPVIDAWRSPYFEALAPIPGDADRLDALARQGLVIQGLDQWREAFALQLSKPSTLPPVTDEEFAPPYMLSPADTLALQNAFEAFVAHLTPPPQASLRHYAAFVEDLIGEDPQLVKDEYGGLKDESLGLVRCVRLVAATTPRDIAALLAFKDVLRGLVLAASFLTDAGQVITYQEFYNELLAAVQGATYYLPPPEPLDAALPVLSVLNARGLSFRAVALIGLAEGEFPRAEREDILLREEDRRALQQAGLTGLETRLRGDEVTLFYEAVTRAREKLLLCRPYLADDGQPWEPSPYWVEARRLFNNPAPLHLRPEDPLPLSEVASPQEFVLWSGNLGADSPLGQAVAHCRHSLAVLRARLAAAAQGPFEGDLSALANRFAAIYGPAHVWSSSRLEAYGLCPHHFWLGQDLALEPRQPPQEGFDVFSLGSMYHEILEKVYRQAGAQTDNDDLLSLLPAIAAQVFDQAPAVYGFRPTALWAMQRRELEQILAENLVALAEATVGSAPLTQEQSFGRDDNPPLVVQRQGDEFRVRGYIDRVDQTADGRLRIIDYKSGATPIAARDLAEGRRLQIALYALAARDALALGDIADGFYWHIGAAKASSLKLADFEGGVESALNTALDHAFRHIAGARAGHFLPKSPPAGCPSHCPGAAFCWRYKAKGW